LVDWGEIARCQRRRLCARRVLAWRMPLASLGSLQLVFQADDHFVKCKQLLAIVLIGKSVEEAVNSRLVEGGSQRVQHGRQLDLIDETTVICVVLLKHGSPELLS
jgi:hypothetical protein